MRCNHQTKRSYWTVWSEELAVHRRKLYDQAKLHSITRIRSELEFSTIDAGLYPNFRLSGFHADIPLILGAYDAVTRHLALVYNHNFSSLKFLFLDALYDLSGSTYAMTEKKNKKYNKSCKHIPVLYAPLQNRNLLTSCLPGTTGVLATPMPITTNPQIHLTYSSPI